MAYIDEICEELNGSLVLAVLLTGFVLQKSITFRNDFPRRMKIYARGRLLLRCTKRKKLVSAGQLYSHALGKLLESSTVPCRIRTATIVGAVLQVQVMQSPLDSYMTYTW